MKSIHYNLEIITVSIDEFVRSKSDKLLNVKWR